MLTLEQKYQNVFGVNAAPALEAIALEEADLQNDNRGDLFSIQSMSREITQWDKISGLGRLAETPEGQQVDGDSFQELGLKTFTATKFGIEIAISEEMIDDQRGDLIERHVRALSRAATETQMYNAMNAYNNSFTSELAFDGNALVASRTTPAGTQTNLLSAADLAISSLKIADQTLRKTKDERGKRIMIRGEALVVPTEERHNAIELVQSPFLPGGANNNINSVDQFKVVESPYFTDADAWWLQTAPSDPMHGAKIYDRTPVTRQLHSDERAGVMYYICKYRQAIGFDEWRYIVGNRGAG